MLGEYDAGYEHYIDSLIREIEKLQDENDKLSEQVSSLVGRSFRTADKMSCIEAENAKLRELVADMWRFTGTACKKYPRLFDPAAQGGQTVQLNMIDAFEQRMRELGVDTGDAID